ncbi:MAG: class I SAM-dependent methyltransferase [Acidimicrobiales bacterium]
MSTTSAWRDYLESFHAERPGITEAVLSHSRDGDDTPYEWLAAMLPPRGTVVDVACGSAPTWTAERGQCWIGIDVSRAGLTLARRRGATAVALADATAQPLPDRCAVVVVCSMALMVVEPLDAALQDIRRILAPGGVLVALLPAGGQLSPMDVLNYERLLLSLRTRRLGYPTTVRWPNRRPCWLVPV